MEWTDGKEFDLTVALRDIIPDQLLDGHCYVMHFIKEHTP